MQINTSMLPKGSRGRPESPLVCLPQLNYKKQTKYAAEGVKGATGKPLE